MLAGCAGGLRFAARLPPELPDLHGWEKSSGHAELEGPRRTIDYVLYVSPQRPSVYSVTRYRVSEPGRAGATHEKLQWDRDGRDVRRYECASDESGGSRPCRWREFSPGSREYDGELSTIVAVYFLHAELLNRREARRDR